VWHRGLMRRTRWGFDLAVVQAPLLRGPGRVVEGDALIRVPTSVSSKGLLGALCPSMEVSGFIASVS